MWWSVEWWLCGDAFSIVCWVSRLVGFLALAVWIQQSSNAITGELRVVSGDSELLL